MQHALDTGKRVFAAIIAATTIAFTIGAGALLKPLTAQAADDGDLIKGTSLTTVYYQGFDGLRYAFPNEKTYFSWYPDFDDVMTISDSDLADITLGGNIVVRPGTHFVKVTSDPKTYAVARDGMLHWIETEEVAMDLAGSDWAANIIDVPDVFFDDYTVGTSLMTAMVFDGAVYEMGGTTYLSWDGEMRELTEDGMDANNIMDMFVLDGDNIDDSSLSAGSTIDGEVLALVDAAQTEEGEEVLLGGDVEVSISSSTPEGATLPQGANSVEVFSFDLEAGDEDAEVDGITLNLTSVGATTNISNAYLYEGDTRLTDARSVNSSTRQVSFNSLGLNIDAGDQMTLTLRIEVSTSAAAGDEIAFAIESEDDIVSGGGVDGDFPVEGESFEVANVDAGEIDVTESGSIVDPTLGQQDAKIAEFKITANTESASVEMLTLEIDNADDHDDFQLWANDEMIAAGENIGDKLVTFVPDDAMEIAEGGNEIFEITADIGGEDGDDITVSVENAVDIVAIGGDFGFGMAVDIDDSNGYDGTSCTSVAGKCSFSEVQGGDVTIAFSGPSTGDISTNAQDQTVMEFSITAENEITVQDLDIIIGADDADDDGDPFDGTESGNDDDDRGLINGDNDGVADSDDAASVTDIKIVNTETGTVLMGPMELDSAAVGGNDAVQTIDFTDDFTMDAGETLDLAVVIDIDNDVTTGTEFGATIDISGFSAEDTNGDTVTDIVPSADLVGFAQEANTSSLTVALASSPVSTTVVQGIQGVDVLGFSMRAGDGADVTVESITFAGYADDTNGSDMTEGGAATFQIEDFVSSCSLFNSDGDLVDGSEGISTAGALVFNAVDFVVEASETELFTLNCNLSNPADTDDDVIAFEIETTSSITANDEDGNSPSITLTSAGSGDEGINDTNTADGTFDASTAITITPSGTIVAAAASSTPQADFLVTGSTENYVGQFNFTATSEDFLVDKLVINEEAATDNGETSTSEYANNISKVWITYTDSTGVEVTDDSIMSGRSATFTGMDFLVETGQNNYLAVYVDVPASARNSGGAAVSNERVEVGISSTSGNFNAVGTDSGVTDIAADAAETGRTYVVKEVKPTLAVNASSPTGAKVPGDIEVLRFDVTATDNEDIVLNEVLFKLNAVDNAETAVDNTPDWNECETDESPAGTGVIAADFDFYNLDEEGLAQALDINADWSIRTTTGAACGAAQLDVGYAHLTLTTPEIIPAGETYTYSLYWDVSTASAANDDIIQVTIPNDGSLFVTVANASNEADVAITDTTIAVDDGTAFTAGDVIVMDLDDDAAYDIGSEEVMLVTGVATNDLTVVRGYLGSGRSAADADAEATYEYEVTDDVLRFPTSFFWEDDGTTSTSATGEDWGSYLVDGIETTASQAISF